MKKAGIITHYDVHNHGAHLQMYATIKFLEREGFKAKALRFQKNYDFIGGEAANQKYNISVKSIPIYVKYLLSKGFKRTFYNYKKRKLLASFRNENNLVGDYYSLADDLDVVVIGSDEIFSVEAGPNPWYYGIGTLCSRKMSYAASFGPTTLEIIQHHNIGPLVSAGLNGINHISVRDRNSYDLVKHFTGEEAEIVCDPVLLYDFPEQLEKKEINVSPSKDKYCIVYSYDDNMNDETTVNAIKNYARENGIKVYSIAYFHKWCDKNVQVKPLDLFRWFANAEMVFTDTFHGSVISIATGTQFISKTNGNANKLEFLLEQFDVSERIVKSFDVAEIEKVSSKRIDFNKVNEVKNNIRRRSASFFRNCLEDLIE